MHDVPTDSAARSAGSQPLRRLAHRDGVRVLLATLLTFVCASGFEWQERVASLSARFERWQVDELPLTLLALSLGLAWYAWRRRSDSNRLLAHNRELAQRLIEVQERERRELARELHDELAQHCTAIRVEAAFLQRCADAREAAGAAQRVAGSAASLQQGVQRLLRRLRPAELDELGLPSALQALAANWEARSGVGCSVQVDGALDGVDDPVATCVYRIVQEAISNVVQHAGAAQVRVELAVAPSTLQFSVCDDGCGFDAARATRGLGLLGASERAAALGGRLGIESAPGTGTRLRVSLPLGLAPAPR